MPLTPLTTADAYAEIMACRDLDTLRRSASHRLYSHGRTAAILDALLRALDGGTSAERAAWLKAAMNHRDYLAAIHPEIWDVETTETPW